MSELDPQVADLMRYLIACPNDTPYACVEGTGLTILHKRLFNNKTSVPKKDMVQNLTNFYLNKQNIINLWNGLSECEQDFIRYIVQCSGEHLPTTLLYAKKHNLKLQHTTPNGHKQDITSPYTTMRFRFLHLLSWNIPNTKTVIFFPGANMPPIVFQVLKNLVGSITFTPQEYHPIKTDYIICRENRISDFATLVKLTTSEHLKVKPQTYDLTPTKLAKLAELIDFEEVCDKAGKFCPPKEAKHINDFKVTLPLFVLAANSTLLDIDKDGYVKPGTNAPALLSKPPHELIKQLFTDYLKQNKIHELHFVTNIGIRDSYWQIDWYKCRNSIIELLKICPVEKFITFESLNKHAEMYSGNFFRRLFYGDVVLRGYKIDRYYGDPYELDWDECEAQIIRLSLTFLSAMGLVDIAYTENVARIKYADDDFCVGIAGFRITKLGAWVFGLRDKYETTNPPITLNDEGQLLVLPDYSVIISGLKCRIEHETYFSKFLTRHSVDGNAAVYKLDFPSIIRAHDINITPQKIKKALQKASGKPLPDNVGRSLDDWQLKIGRVKIRTLTLLETDDALLLEEIKHIKGMGSIITNELLHAIAIDDQQQKKAKTLIEKNGWPVKL